MSLIQQNRQLVDDSILLVRARCAELGIEAETPADLFNKAKELTLRQKELQTQNIDLQKQVKFITPFDEKKCCAH